MNALESYRTQHSLTFEAMADLSGVDKGNVNKHCRGLKPIRGESALRYHVDFGIPLPDLRPDLYGDRRPPAQPSPPAQPDRQEA